MSASLVGSEMCIRDRGPRSGPTSMPQWTPPMPWGPGSAERLEVSILPRTCLLYTSDAADDM
eukprot:1389280-Alexandrium_andersonii.AAC.1